MDNVSGGFWRVYQREWTAVYSSDATGGDGRAECERRLQAVCQGGIVPREACRIVPWSSTDQGEWPWQLEVELLVLKGEYRELAGAEEHVNQTGGETCREGSRYDKGAQDLLRRLTAAVTA